MKSGSVHTESVCPPAVPALKTVPRTNVDTTIRGRHLSRQQTRFCVKITMKTAPTASIREYNILTPATQARGRVYLSGRIYTRAVRAPLHLNFEPVYRMDVDAKKFQCSLVRSQFYITEVDCCGQIHSAV